MSEAEMVTCKHRGSRPAAEILGLCAPCLREHPELAEREHPELVEKVTLEARHKSRNPLRTTDHESQEYCFTETSSKVRTGTTGYTLFQSSTLRNLTGEAPDQLVFNSQVFWYYIFWYYRRDVPAVHTC